VDDLSQFEVRRPQLEKQQISHLRKGRHCLSRGLRLDQLQAAQSQPWIRRRNAGWNGPKQLDQEILPGGEFEMVILCSCSILNQSWPFTSAIGSVRSMTKIANL
jgi:hypothetical protein